MSKEQVIIVGVSALVLLILQVAPKSGVLVSPKKNILTENQGQPENKKITSLAGKLSLAKTASDSVEILHQIVDESIRSNNLWIASEHQELLVSMNKTKGELKKAAQINFRLFESEDSARSSIGYSRAAKYYDACAEFDTTSEVLVEKAVLEVFGSNPMQAIVYLRDFLQKQPSNYLANFYLGKFSLQTGQIEKAKQRFLQAARSDTSKWEPYYFMAICLQQADSLSLADKYFGLAKGRAKDFKSKETIQNQIKKFRNK